jgi:hypothetical protein
MKERAACAARRLDAGATDLRKDRGRQARAEAVSRDFSDFRQRLRVPRACTLSTHAGNSLSMSARIASGFAVEP